MWRTIIRKWRKKGSVPKIHCDPSLESKENPHRIKRKILGETLFPEVQADHGSSGEGPISVSFGRKPFRFKSVRMAQMLIKAPRGHSGPDISTPKPRRNWMVGAAGPGGSAALAVVLNY
jgi:hypothetical protein